MTAFSWRQKKTVNKWNALTPTFATSGGLGMADMGKVAAGAGGSVTRATSAQLAVMYPNSSALWTGRAVSSAYADVTFVKSS